MIYVVFENQFFQGDFIGKRFLGVFSSDDGAQEHIAVESSDAIFDPMMRSSYQVVPVEIDEPYYEDED